MVPAGTEPPTSALSQARGPGPDPLAGDLHPDRVVQRGSLELLDLAGHGGGVEVSVPLLWHHLQNLIHLGKEEESVLAGPASSLECPLPFPSGLLPSQSPC